MSTATIFSTALLLLVTTLGLSGDPFLASKLLFFTIIFDSNDIDYFYSLFRSTLSTTFLYNTVISDFSQTKTPNRLASLYILMLRSGLPSDHLTFPFLLKFFTCLSSAPLDTLVHYHIAKLGLELNLYVQNSLIHMYTSCGDIATARKVFDDIPLHESMILLDEEEGMTHPYEYVISRK